jgi:hypothetical protein
MQAALRALRDSIMARARKTYRYFEPFRFTDTHITGWEYWKDQHGRTMLRTLRLRRMSTKEHGIIVVHKPKR